MNKNTVRRISFLLLAVAIASCSGSKHAATRRLPGVWQKEPIVADGDNRDWPSPYPHYDDKAMLGYAISNDKDNLYITVETGDPATQLKILREGLTVWIDKTGGKEQVTAINYPLPNHTKITTDEGETAPGQWQHGNGSAADKRRLDMEDRVRQLLAQAKEYSLQGFKGCNLQYPVSETDSCGIVVRMKIDADNEMVWEVIVPFRSFYHRRQVELSDRGKPLSICFETVGTKRPAGKSGGNNHHRSGFSPQVGFGGIGVMGMGVGMRSGGRSTPGDNRQGSYNIMESLYKSTLTWTTVGIAIAGH